MHPIHSMNSEFYRGMSGEEHRSYQEEIAEKTTDSDVGDFLRAGVWERCEFFHRMACIRGLAIVCRG